MTTAADNYDEGVHRHCVEGGDEWIEFDSEWSSLPEIQQLWVNIFAWLGPQNSCQLIVD